MSPKNCSFSQELVVRTTTGLVRGERKLSSLNKEVSWLNRSSLLSQVDIWASIPLNSFRFLPGIFFGFFPGIFRLISGQASPLPSPRSEIFGSWRLNQNAAGAVNVMSVKILVFFKWYIIYVKYIWKIIYHITYNFSAKTIFYSSLKNIVISWSKSHNLRVVQFRWGSLPTRAVSLSQGRSTFRESRWVATLFSPSFLFINAVFVTKNLFPFTASLTGHVSACLVHIEGFNGTLETITVACIWALWPSLFLHMEIPLLFLEELFCWVIICWKLRHPPTIWI